MNEKLAGLLGLARRAGRMQLGFDAVKGKIYEHKARLILLASDISPKTEKELRFAYESADSKAGWAKLDAGKETLSGVVGANKPVGAVSIDDAGFAKAILKVIQQPEEGNAI